MATAMVSLSFWGVWGMEFLFYFLIFRPDADRINRERLVSANERGSSELNMLSCLFKSLSLKAWPFSGVGLVNNLL
jgi:hypothetical protein